MGTVDKLWIILICICLWASFTLGIYGVNAQVEDVSQRTHHQQVFQYDGYNKMLLYSSPKFFYDGTSYQEIPVEQLKFPEGKEISDYKSVSEIIKIPEWATAKLSEDQREVILYDKQEYPITTYRSAGYTDSKTELSKSAEPDTAQTAKEVIIPTTFKVENGYIGFNLKEVDLLSPIKIYDDVNSTSTLTKDTHLQSVNPNNNFGTEVQTYIQSKASSKWRYIQQWELPTRSGTISDVKSKLHVNDASHAGTHILQVYELLTNAWVEVEATWNKYDNTHSWTSAGGDYDSDLIATTTPSDSVGQWDTYIIQGTGSNLPLSLSFGDTFGLLYKWDSESDSDALYSYQGYDTSEALSNQPYLEITYTDEQTGSSSEETMPIILPGTVPFNNELTVITGYQEVYENGSTTPSQKIYTWYHIPFIAFIIIGVLMLYLFSRIIIEILIRLRP